MNRNTTIAGAVALVAIATALIYLTSDPTDQGAVTNAPEKNGAAPTAPAARHDATSQGETTSAPGGTDSKPLPADPRLAALQVSPDNGLIKFVTAADGKVIAEIDQDPGSSGYGKPTREYVYAGDKVVGLTAYRYMRDHVEVTRTMVAYKPDGSVEDIKESTSYEDVAKKSR